MLIRNHISTAKRFFKRTLDSLKSFLSKGEDSSSSYERLLRTPSFKPFSCEEEFTFVGGPPKCKKVDEDAKIVKEACQESDPVGFNDEKSSNTSYDVRRHVRRLKLQAVEKREVRMRKVAERLKELEKADTANVDHMLDIEEVFHYYSRLTSPAFLEIVEQFFMEMQAEFMGADQSSEFLQWST